LPEAVSDLWGLPSKLDKVRKILVLACEVPGKRFPHFEEADIQEVLGCHAAQLIEGDLETADMAQ
jgi:hypothetical protein